MIKIKQQGDFKKTSVFLEQLKRGVRESTLRKYGEAGVKAMSSATPVDTGLTAASWRYELEHTKQSATLSFYNTNVQNGVQIAIILQYGHGTGTGGWVQGRDYINPAIQPVFDELAEKAWKEVVTI